MPVTCSCIKCKKEFKVSPYKKNTSKFCSQECHWNYEKEAKRDKWITKICPSCNKEFKTLKSRSNKYCSDKCRSERNENYMMYNCDCCGKEIRIKKSYHKRLLDGKQKSITCSKECSYKMKHTGYDVTCENCGKQFYRRKYHIELHSHQFCSNNCQLEYQHQYKFETRKCEICNSEFECSKTSTQRFCSNKCNAEWQKTIVGEACPQFTSEKKNCDCCNKEIYVAQNKLKKYTHFFCNEKCRQEWYATDWSQRKEWREKKRIDAVKILESGAISKTNSKPQQIIDNILDKNNIKYEREKGFKYYCADNYLENNLIIEVQGDYWHANPLKYDSSLNKMQYERIKKDKAKRTYIKKYHGIEILYLWENDIYNDLTKCENLILEYIKRNGNLKNYHSFNYYLDENEKLQLQDKIIVPYQEMNCAEYKHLYKTT